jgi:hypothetical protein
MSHFEPGEILTNSTGTEAKVLRSNDDFLELEWLSPDTEFFKTGQIFKIRSKFFGELGWKSR